MATGRRVSWQTIRNRSHDIGLRARGPMRLTPLTPEARRHRREWAEEHQHWGAEQWRSVLFSDESRFCLHPDNQRVRV